MCVGNHVEFITDMLKCGKCTSYEMRCKIIRTCIWFQAHVIMESGRCMPQVCSKIYGSLRTAGWDPNTLPLFWSKKQGFMKTSLFYIEMYHRDVSISNKVQGIFAELVTYRCLFSLLVPGSNPGCSCTSELQPWPVSRPFVSVLSPKLPVYSFKGLQAG